MGKTFTFPIEVETHRTKRQTIAVASLRIKGVQYFGYGASLKHENDKDRPLVGQKIAVAEALSSLARKIKGETWEDIKVTKPVPKETQKIEVSCND